MFFFFFFLKQFHSKQESIDWAEIHHQLIGYPLVLLPQGIYFLCCGLINRFGLDPVTSTPVPASTLFITKLTSAHRLHRVWSIILQACHVDLQMQTWSQNGFGCISVFLNDTYGWTYLWIDKHAGRCSCAHMSHLALRQWLKLKNTGDCAAPTVSHCLWRVDFWEGIQEFVGDALMLTCIATVLLKPISATLLSSS